MRDISEVIRSKTSQRDQLGREIQILTQALAILNIDEDAPPLAVPAPVDPTKVNPWP